jgi:hypothetical protein
MKHEQKIQKSERGNLNSDMIIELGYQVADLEPATRNNKPSKMECAGGNQDE